MTHLLDTNICSTHMRRTGGLAHRFFQYAGGIAISTVVLAEIHQTRCGFRRPGRLCQSNARTRRFELPDAPVSVPARAELFFEIFFPHRAKELRQISESGDLTNWEYCVECRY